MPRLRNIIWLSEKRLNSIPLVGYIVQQWTDLSTIFVDIYLYTGIYIFIFNEFVTTKSFIQQQELTLQAFHIAPNKHGTNAPKIFLK